MSNKKVAQKRRRIVIFIMAIVIAAFFYFGSSNNDNGFEVLNNKVKEFISYIDNEIGLDLVGESTVLKPKIDGELVAVHLIDVGQAEAILITTKDGNILIDSGEYESGSKKVSSYLRLNNVEKIDLLVATHPHSDHIGGMAYIVEEFNIEQLAMPDIPVELMPSSNYFNNLLAAIEDNEGSIITITEDTSYDFGKAKLKFLSPIVGESAPDINNLSTIARLDVEDISFLFTGDAESWSEEKLLEYNKDIDIDILNVAHHGSKTSTGEDFLTQTTPEVAIISCGTDNSYGHPHREVVYRLKNNGAEVYRTDLNGDMVVVTNGKEYEVMLEKD